LVATYPEAQQIVLVEVTSIVIDISVLTVPLAGTGKLAAKPPPTATAATEPTPKAAPAPSVKVIPDGTVDEFLQVIEVV